MVPFTDVVLVLLVIFMVTTPFLFQGAFQVSLPKVSAPSPNLPEVVTLSVTQGGKVYLDEREVPLEELMAALTTAVKKNPQAQFVVNADKGVSHGTVMGVMSEAYKAGVTKVALAVEQDKHSEKQVVPIP